MADYGRSLEFGFFLNPNAADYPELASTARLVDEVGLELTGIQDHPYQSAFLDTWTMLAAIAAQTTRVHVFPDVANLPLRPPAMLAKAAASLDVISGGRFELGLGTGAFWDGIVAMGGPRHEARDAVSALEEAIAVIRLFWSGERSVRYVGQFYSLHGAHPGPAPAHDIGIWLGAIGPRMLGITGRLADGWIPSSSYVPPEKLPEMNARIDEAAERAGRAPSAVRRLYNLFGEITDGAQTGFLQGPVEHWVDTLTTISIEHGMDSYIFGTDGQPDAQIRTFALEVAPRVRENVAKHRGTSS